MSTREPDWDPTSDAVLADQEAAYDDMRRRCPVAYSEFGGWSLFKHEDVARVLRDHATFSNVVSAHRSVPNGMDPPEHTAYRQAIEGFFASERMARFAPECRAIARSLLEELPLDEAFDFVEGFALPFAVACQCAFLGWPQELMASITGWARENQAATLAGNREALSALAKEFRACIANLLEQRRAANAPANDVTRSCEGRRGSSSFSRAMLGERSIRPTAGKSCRLCFVERSFRHAADRVAILNQRVRSKPKIPLGAHVLSFF